MDERTLEILDFPRVLEMLAESCLTPMGRERALKLRPSADPGWVNGELDRVGESLGLSEEPGLGGVGDPRALLARVRQGAVLNGEELLQIRKACVGIRLGRDFFCCHRDRLPRVWAVAKRMTSTPDVENAIDKSVDEYGQVRDSATPLLQETRSSLRRMRNRLLENLERLAAGCPDWFSGGPAVRRDRLVLPVRLEQRNRVPGVVHESSGSGSTLFVEPMETVEDQNRMEELRDVEATEVARVLRRLSDTVATQAVAIAAGLETVGELDLLLAKRRFALRFGCHRPEIATDGELNVRSARHPILLRRKSEVVPLDFAFPDGVRVVLISGPNAGGKTVALKTIGLLSLMLGGGMFLPVAEGTKLPLYRQVFADIGDEQSLDSDLSSFTAHVGRLAQIIAVADESCLALVDEVGSSTAPEEGSALAMAVLEALRDAGARVAATSHSGALKLSVQHEPGMANAAMGFRDRRPTYRLTIGRPGESSAFEMAADAGLPPSLIERAKSRVGQDRLNLGARLQELEDELERAKRARLDAESEKRRAEQLRVTYDEKLSELEHRVKIERQRLQASEEALLRETRTRIENLVRAIRESRAERSTIVEAKGFIERRLETLVSAVEEDNTAGEQFDVGDTVESRTFRRQGVVAALDVNVVTVAFGQIRVRLQRQDLLKVKGAVPVGRPDPIIDEPYRPDTRLSIRGMTREEASEAVSRFLDEAFCFEVKQLVVVHGKGSGALRAALWAMLRRDSRVQGFRLGDAAEGGGGVTVVTLRSGGD